ncbi:MAG TPA: carbohydrate kinase family protein [Gemmatimonadaceae bacterium]|nr:carbohydrate kinase family protein [Gemmatimonadaceae bacterium]
MTSPGIDFLVVGDVYVDVILGEMPRVPTIGADTFAATYDITLGGSGAITAHGLACLSRTVSLITSIGDDLFAEFLIERLKRASASCINQRSSNGSTGLSVSFSHAGDRGFLSVPMPLAAWDVVPRLVLSLAPSHVHVSSHPHIRGMVEHFPAILDAARANGSTISADPAGPGDQSPDPLLSFADAPKLDILFVNESEACAFAGAPNPDDASLVLLELADLVVLKRGERGASVFQREGSALHTQGLKAPYVDPTGAGDTFASAFLHAWRSEHRSELDVCLEFANAAAAASIGFLGGVKSHFELPALYRANEARRQ